MKKKRLVIAEKPSVGMSVAKVLGAKERRDGYMEGCDYIVSWGVGHLAELVPPDVYDEKYAKWHQNDLPIIPAMLSSSFFLVSLASPFKSLNSISNIFRSRSASKIR